MNRTIKYHHQFTNTPLTDPVLKDYEEYARYVDLDVERKEGCLNYMIQYDATLYMIKSYQEEIVEAKEMLTLDLSKAPELIKFYLEQITKSEQGIKESKAFQKEAVEGLKGWFT